VRYEKPTYNPVYEEDQDDPEPPPPPSPISKVPSLPPVESYPRPTPPIRQKTSIVKMKPPVRKFEALQLQNLVMTVGSFA